MMATNMPRGARRGAAAARAASTASTRSATRRKAGRIRTYEGYLDKVPHELTAERDRQARHDHAVRDRRHDQGPRQRGADHRDPRRPRRHHLARRHQGEAAQGPRPARGRRVHRARAARRRASTRPATPSSPTARGTTWTSTSPRSRRAATTSAWSRSIPPEDQFTRWRSEYEADVMVSPGVAGRGADVLRRRQLVRRVRRPRVARRRSPSFMEGYWGMGSTDRPRTGSRTGSASAGGGRPGGGRTTRARTRPAQGQPRRAHRGQARRAARSAPRRSCGRTGSQVLAVAHALETHKTLTGEDIEAVIEGRRGPTGRRSTAYAHTRVRRAWPRSTTARRCGAHARARRGPTLPLPDGQRPRLGSMRRCWRPRMCPGRHAPATAAPSAAPRDGEPKVAGTDLQHPLHQDDVEPLAELAADLALDADELEAARARAARSTPRGRRRCGRSPSGTRGRRPSRTSSSSRSRPMPWPRRSRCTYTESSTVVEYAGRGRNGESEPNPTTVAGVVDGHDRRVRRPSARRSTRPARRACGARGRR